MREVERLFLDSIDTAEHRSTSRTSFSPPAWSPSGIARRMQANGRSSRSLLIGPQNHESWVEARTMRNGRIRFMRTLAEAGVGDRVRLVYPHVENGKHVHRHDDALQGHDHRRSVPAHRLRQPQQPLDGHRHGMRSGHRGQQPLASAKRSRVIRHRLLADHTGVTPSAVGKAFQAAAGPPLPHANFPRAGHSLRRVDDGEPDPEEMARYIEGIADPERPIPVDALLSMEMSGRKAAPSCRERRPSSSRRSRLSLA